MPLTLVVSMAVSIVVRWLLEDLLEFFNCCCQIDAWDLVRSTVLKLEGMLVLGVRMIGRMLQICYERLSNLMGFIIRGMPRLGD